MCYHLIALRDVKIQNKCAGILLAGRLLAIVFLQTLLLDFMKERQMVRLPVFACLCQVI